MQPCLKFKSAFENIDEVEAIGSDKIPFKLFVFFQPLPSAKLNNGVFPGNARIAPVSPTDMPSSNKNKE